MEKRTSMEERQRFWEQHLREWKSSGLSQAEFCRRNKLSQKSFVYWKKKQKTANSPICLVEVPAQRRTCVSFHYRPAGSPAPLRLLVGSQYRVEIEKDFDNQALDQLIKFLSER